MKYTINAKPSTMIAFNHKYDYRFMPGATLDVGDDFAGVFEQQVLLFNILSAYEDDIVLERIEE